MYIFEKEISLENRDELLEYLNGYSYETSGLSFTSLYMWRKSNQFSYQIIGDYLCISGVSHLEIGEKEIYFSFPPLTKTGKYERESLKETIYESKRIFEEKGVEYSIRLVPGAMKDILKEAVPSISFTDDRPNYDYIYLRENLELLKGKRYHAKKNYINSFKKNYTYEYVNITSAMKDEIMNFVREFNRKKELDEHDKMLLELEEEAMYDVFSNFEEAGYIGGAIRIDGKIKAVAAGGTTKGSFIEHIEKADISYRGLYPAILNEVVKAIPEEIEFINREEDMDMENLRKAKLSYHPFKLLDKYIGEIV